MQKRWYDIDPTVSLAVSLIKNSSEEAQLKCADYIIMRAKNYGIKNKENALNEAFTYILRRWYDKDKKIQESFEYLKSAPLDLQKEIALEIINVLQVI
ncbi:MAG: hypothetical protein ACI4SM_06050 [Candidatus Gastranaerophilaceae bacterium]